MGSDKIDRPANTVAKSHPSAIPWELYQIPWTRSTRTDRGVLSGPRGRCTLMAHYGCVLRSGRPDVKDRQTDWKVLDRGSS